MKLNERELATVLAALRLAQQDPPELAHMPRFNGGIAPLSDDMIDDLCERLNTDDHGFTVVLAYPDYLDETGVETYLEWSNEPTVLEAVQDVQRQAAKAQADRDIDPDDFAVVVVFAGHIDAEAVGRDF